MLRTANLPWPALPSIGSSDKVEITLEQEALIEDGGFDPDNCPNIILPAGTKIALRTCRNYGIIYMANGVNYRY